MKTRNQFMVENLRPKIIAGNWKMHKTTEEALHYIKKLIPIIKSTSEKVYLAVPFTALISVCEECAGTNITVGAQNMYEADEGAFTGEISARMLKEVGAQFVLLGHSERRQIFSETNEFINKKVLSALAVGIQPILCVGETLEEREQGLTERVLVNQIEGSLGHVYDHQLENMVIAYEPVWAIGTGQTATPEQAQEMHAYCRKVIENEWGDETAIKVPILYGGSVRPDNVKNIMEQPDIDGVLVGGASLSPESFGQIINYQTINV